jgi:translation initiation factor 2 gamma subunit (eIF-2gamma)
LSGIKEESHCYLHLIGLFELMSEKSWISCFKSFELVESVVGVQETTQTKAIKTAETIMVRIFVSVFVRQTVDVRMFDVDVDD